MFGLLSRAKPLIDYCPARGYFQIIVRDKTLHVGGLFSETRLLLNWQSKAIVIAIWVKAADYYLEQGYRHVAIWNMARQILVWKRL